MIKKVGVGRRRRRRLTKVSLYKEILQWPRYNRQHNDIRLSWRNVRPSNHNSSNSKPLPNKRLLHNRSRHNHNHSNYVLHLFKTSNHEIKTTRSPEKKSHLSHVQLNHQRTNTNQSLREKISQNAIVFINYECVIKSCHWIRYGRQRIRVLLEHHVDCFNGCWTDDGNRVD